MGGTKRRVPARRKRSLKSLKKEADRVFSIWIRKRGMSPDGSNTCVSCGDVKPWSELQCGHYLKRNHLATRYHEDNCWPQCPTCNVFRYGNYPGYAKFMYQTLGEERVEKLFELHNRITKLTHSDYEELIKKYS